MKVFNLYKFTKLLSSMFIIICLIGSTFTLSLAAPNTQDVETPTVTPTPTLPLEIPTNTPTPTPWSETPIPTTTSTSSPETPTFTPTPLSETPTITPSPPVYTPTATLTPTTPPTGTLPLPDETGTLVGVVYHARTGQRIEGATVTATCTGDTIITTARGYYSFENLPVGLCRITASKMGYFDNATDRYVIANDTRWASVPLEPTMEQSGSLIGIVYDTQTGTRLENPTVTACNGETVTGSFYGFYRFINLPSGNCNITAQKAGYQSNSKIGFVEVDGVRWNSIGLTPEGSSNTLNNNAVNGGKTNIFDLAFIASHYDGDDPLADLNIDGVVDIFDLVIAVSNYEEK